MTDRFVLYPRVLKRRFLDEAAAVALKERCDRLSADFALLRGLSVAAHLGHKRTELYVEVAGHAFVDLTDPLLDVAELERFDDALTELVGERASVRAPDPLLGRSGVVRLGTSDEFRFNYFERGGPLLRFLQLCRICELSHRYDPPQPDWAWRRIVVEDAAVIPPAGTADRDFLAAAVAWAAAYGVPATFELPFPATPAPLENEP